MINILSYRMLFEEEIDIECCLELFYTIENEITLVQRLLMTIKEFAMSLSFKLNYPLKKKKL